MKKLIFTLLLLFVVADFAAAQNQNRNRNNNRNRTNAGRTRVAVTPANVVQTISLKVTDDGYEPSSLELKAGKAYKLMVTRETNSGCASKIQFPTFGIQSTTLPKGQAVGFDLKPTETGNFTFACGMNMMKGTIVVKQ